MKRRGGRVALAAPACEHPRVRVAALILIDGRVALVRHRKNGQTYHLLPGGGVDWGEPLFEALTREVAEETGLTLEVGRPLFINDTIDPDGERHVINITFAATVTGGSITDEPSDARVEAVDLVVPGELGSLDLRPPLAREIQTSLEGGPAYEATYLGSIFTP